MPAGEFAGRFAWGYNPAHIFADRERYGGPDGLKAFVEAAHAARHRGDPRRGLQPLRPAGPGDLWRFDGWQPRGDRRRHLLLQRLAAPDALGRHAPGLRPAEVRQFIRDNALFWLEEFRVGRAALGHDALHPHGRTATHDDGRDLPDGWTPDAVDQRGDRRAPAVEDQHRRGPAERRLDHAGRARTAARASTPVGREFVHPVRARAAAAATTRARHGRRARRHRARATAATPSGG